MRRLVGSLMYAAVMTRPDISKAAQVLSQVMANPTHVHIALAKRVFKYLYATRHQALVYRARGSLTIRMMSDAAYADNAGDRSTTGFVLSLGGAAVSWQTNTLDSIVDSTTEAEFYAVSAAAKEALWWQRFLASLPDMLWPTTEDSISPVVLNDNLQTLRVLKLHNSRFKTRLRHVDIKRSWIKQQVQRKTISVQHISTKENLADAMTRIYPGPRYGEIREALGLE